MYKIAYFLLLSCYLPAAVAKENSMEKLLKMPFEQLYNLKVAPSPKSKINATTNKSKTTAKKIATKKQISKKIKFRAKKTEIPSRINVL